MNRALPLAVAALVSTGCAGVSKRPADFWYVDSTPQGAVVTTSLGNTCVTPCRLNPPRWTKDVKGFTFRLAKDGYLPIEGEAVIRPNEAAVEGMALGVLLAVAGIPPVPVPGQDQGLMRITPNPAMITLTPVETPPQESASPR